MNVVRKRKLLRVFFLVTCIAIVVALVSFALRQNISLFFSPTEIRTKNVPLKQKIRLGGMVMKGSVRRNLDDLTVQFTLTDYKNQIIVHYRGILPDLFREEQGIVALGQMLDNHHFKADEVLAKHDANYMPPEVKAALAKTTRIKKLREAG